MRLCSLELHGFKSFPDKTYLKFDDGITAVVGPNGSGKSNISDAVRWVFGEQSTKTLRGGKMEDIIFSGTQTRKAVGYASVKLTIENLSSDFAGEEAKTTISRRLYRSGESQYKINGNIVRLKDVYELFMDTGLGRDGYSIIGQGRISEIVSAKSGQRREIFEEAAGIAKFRYRRNEAERQLLGAEENLLRLNDILAELEDRVGPLKIQSEKAKKYLVLAEERKALEISLWIEGLEKLKEESVAQQDKVNIAKNDYNLLEVEGENLENQLAEVYQEMQRLAVSADNNRGLIKQLESEQSESDSKVAVLKNDIHHNSQTIDRLKEQLESEGKGGTVLETVIKEKETKCDALVAQLAFLKTEIEHRKTRLIVQLEKSQQLQQQLDGLNARKNSLSSASAEIKLKQAANQSVLSESLNRLDDLNSKDSEYDKIVAEYLANVAECNTQIHQQRDTIKALENSRNGYMIKRDSRLKKREELVQQQKAEEREIEQVQARAKLLKDMEASMEGYAGSVKYILNQSKKGQLGGIFGAVSSLISVEPRYITAVETALGAAAQNLVVEDETAAKRGIAMLRDAKIGRATFLPMTSIKGHPMNFNHLKNNSGFIGSASSLVVYDNKFAGIIDQLLGRICVVDDLNTGTFIAKQAGYKFRIVTLDGQVINAGGSYTGGAVSKSAGVLGRRHEIEKLITKAEELTVKRSLSKPILEKATEELVSLEATITGATAEIRTAGEELVRLGFLNEQMENQLKNATINRDLAKLELEKLSEKLKNLEQGKVGSKQLIDDHSQQMEKLDFDIEEIAILQDKLKSESEENKTDLSESQMIELTSIKDIEMLQDELKRFKLQVQTAEQQTKKTEEEIERLKRENQRIQKDIEGFLERTSILKEEIRVYNKTISEAMLSRTNREQSTTLLRQQERELSGKREGVSRELVRLEERQNATQTKYDDTIAQLWDEYELTRSAAVELAKPLDDLIASNQRLAQLKNQIKSLGSVNLEAVEEYNEVGERYEFLAKQVADVEHSRKQLVKLINDLTGEMRTIFEENFEKIREEFSRTFVELFGGGRGELRLTEGEDILEAGIDINVQPPGKVIKNLSLLSGGEQAFVAIAIYFAILKVKPAPFVLLDEIEAALDDVNVVKYANYLRSLAGGIQFIAITHRRGTMEEADVLYGVTMQEDGVSKLLELKISEVESKLGMEAEG